MDFENIEKILKENFKLILIICLSLILLINETENFTTTQALDAVIATEKKVNEMVSKVDGSHVRFPKKVVLDKGLAMGSLKMAPGNWLDYGIEVPAGKKVGIHAPGNGTMELHVDNTIKTAKICLGGTCIDENDLQMMKSGRIIGGYVLNGDGTTHLLEEGGIYNLYKWESNNKKYDAWSNDRWDIGYIYKGWKADFWQHYKGYKHGLGKLYSYENKKHNVMKCDMPNDTVSSYKLTWVGY
jgi:hypothetical protein